jgi:hypothetical protein
MSSARPWLHRTLVSTSPIESCLSTVEQVARNVKRWRGGQGPRWTAMGLRGAEKKLNASLTQQEQAA